MKPFCVISGVVMLVVTELYTVPPPVSGLLLATLHFRFVSVLFISFLLLISIPYIPVNPHLASSDISGLSVRRQE